MKEVSGFQRSVSRNDFESLAGNWTLEAGNLYLSMTG
jgi:hypothetical protein